MIPLPEGEEPVNTWKKKKQKKKKEEDEKKKKQRLKSRGDTFSSTLHPNSSE